MIDQSYDVVILGGGLDGLCLGIQLKRTHPSMNILIAEMKAHPATEAAHKVDESTAEIAAAYYSEVLGMNEHLVSQQLIKPSLRFFFPAGDNTDIAQRLEVGITSLPKYVVYQFDREHFENALGLENKRLGVTFLDDCSVQSLDITHLEDHSTQSSTPNGAKQHTVILCQGEQEFMVHARWVVDASGRASLIKRQLNLAKSTDHNANTAWFRIGQRIDIDQWSENTAWHARVPADSRWHGTVRLMGTGYRVQLIPLASNATSVGIVADEDIHPFSSMHSFDLVLEWLRTHEPQCAKAIEAHSKDLQDFLVLKHDAYDCEQVYSPNRWSLVGEAGLFTDPFYSPSADFIAVSNTLTTDLICRDLRGEDITEATSWYNWFYRDFLFDFTLKTYQGLYPLWGNSQVMTTKITFDYAVYWGIIAPLFFQNKLCDLPFMQGLKDFLLRTKKLYERTQAVLSEWGKNDQQEWRNIFINQKQIDFLYELHTSMKDDDSDEQLLASLQENLTLLEVLATTIVEKARLRGGISTKTRESFLLFIFTLPERNALTSEELINMEDELDTQLAKIWFDQRVPAGV